MKVPSSGIRKKANDLDGIKRDLIKVTWAVDVHHGASVRLGFILGIARFVVHVISPRLRCHTIVKIVTFAPYSVVRC